MIFVQNGRPALAFTSERSLELFTYVTHTPKDSPELVDFEKLVETSSAIRDILMDLDRIQS